MTTPKEKFETKKLPMMPIRDVVIFPYMMTPFVVGRESSVHALEEALAADKKIFLATQHDASVDEPKPNEIYQVGTIVNIVQSLGDGEPRLHFVGSSLDVRADTAGGRVPRTLRFPAARTPSSRRARRRRRN